MKSLIRRRFLRTIAFVLAVNLLADCLFPTALYALTSGPEQPDYSGFEPVTTTNMVNEFSGGFTYNLPVLNVPGPNGSSYPMSLSYHSGMGPEEEASWVGFGWSLNPGSINRGKQGIPDDFNYSGGDISSVASDFSHSGIRFYNRMPENVTVSNTPSIALELYSIDSDGDKKPNGTTASLGLSTSFRYNNYRGFGTQLGLQFSLFSGLASLDYSVSGEEPHSFKASINPAALLRKHSKGFKKDKRRMKQLNKMDHRSIGDYTEYYRIINREYKKTKPNKGLKAALASIGSSSAYGFSTLGADQIVTTVSSYKGTSHNVSFNMGVDPTPLHIGPEFGLAGTLTRQKTKEENGYLMKGYLYSSSSDYTVEKEDVYNKRDQYLSIPHQSSDIFSLTGEGVSGAFRLVRPSIDRCSPIEVSSPTTIFNFAYEATVGLNFEPAGFNAGVGLHTLSVSGADNNFSGSTSVNPFFRFDNDMGGNVIFSNNEATKSDHAIAPQIGSLQSTFVDPTGLGHVQSQPGVSSYVGYATVEERYAPSNDYTRFRSRTYDEATRSHVLSNDFVKDRIAEFYTVNEAGNTFVYGLPVFVAGEKSMTYGMNSNNGEISSNGQMAWTGDAEGSKVKHGQSYNGAYAKNHLLTLITSSDYIDRQFDGPTEDDFGGWTSFKYRTAFNPSTYQDKSNFGNWYKWRVPYTGFYYSKGELSDCRDDIGSMQSGFKEIYYLDGIETKTHVAYFITNKSVARTTPEGIVLKAGSGVERTDACSAMDDDVADANVAIDPGSVKKLERLERIELYSKSNPGGKPLSVVYFEYYEDGDPAVLVKNLPNSSYGSGGSRGGKLTLKKVWFEHEGVVSSKIAPYEFKYEYKDLNTEITNANIHDNPQYANLINFANELSANASKQNPSYRPAMVDGWGNNFYKGDERYSEMRPWLYQGEINSGDPGYEVFDPAAWQLKQIKLPSGGEILIQYEQNEYLYVQDQRALAMVNLMSGSYNADKIYINMSDIGFDFTEATSTEKNAYRKILQDYLANEKLYFKFLYRLMDSGSANINNCASDYIDGYVYAEADYDINGFYIQLGTNPPTNGQKRYYKPFDACKSFVTRTKAGLAVNAGCNDPSASVLTNPLAAVKAMAQRAQTDLNKLFDANCQDLSLSHSYVRVPVYHAKRGGGIRVKRVLMYDKGLETGDEVLYGTEYFYQNEDGTSSGVATNEPQNFRMENALVKSINKRRDPSNVERIISGTEKDNFEGPFGEALLPAPSVGYRRVVTQNIHTGKTGTGFKVSEFYTAKEFPFKANISQMEQLKPFPVLVPAIIVNVVVDQKSAAQTYCFVSNNMHGQLHRIAVFGGAYSPGTSESTYALSFEELHEYYEPGEKVNVLKADGSITQDYIGRSENVTLESKRVRDELMDVSVQVDFSGGIFGPYILPQLSACPYFRYELRTLSTTVVNKSVTYTAIPKRTVTSQDGIVHVTENKLFDEKTGAVVATATYDGYADLEDLEKELIPGGPVTVHKGTYTSYGIPAHMVFKNMGQKIQNQRLVLTSPSTLNSSTNVLTIANVSKFTKGDLLRLVSGGTNGLYYVKTVGTGQLTLEKVSFSSTLSGTISSIEIINSGYTNQLNNTATRVVTYGVDPITTGSIDVSNFSPSNVISASADVFSDEWGDSELDADYDLSSVSDFQAGRSGKWRMASSYVYKGTTKDAVSTDKRVYLDAGVLDEAYAPFNYNDFGSLSSKWIRTNSITRYSPHGNALEEENAMGVKSTALFGYNENVPVLVAQNAKYSSVKFKSFEYSSLDEAGAGLIYDNTAAHTGRSSIRYDANTSNTLLSNIRLDDNAKRKGVQVKFWAKADPAVSADINSYLKLSLIASGETYQPVISKIAQVGEWILYEAMAREVKNSASYNFSLGVNYTGANPLWIDDVRFQPYESQMVCYVYDPGNLRLVASFDDQHFGLLYQYNGEGKLVRKMVETERGQKTVSETQYNIPKETY